MNRFQLVFVAVGGAQALVALVRFLRTRHAGSLLFALIWIVAAGIVLRPDVSTSIARAVGIGRGVDFITYTLLSVFLWAHYQHYLRYKRLENHVTTLVRELAIASATRPAGAPRPGPTAPPA